MLVYLFFVIFQLCMPKRYQGTLYVSSSFDVSKLIINGNSSKFVEFQSEYKVSVCILGQTDHATFILWDPECIEILGEACGGQMSEVEKKIGDPTRFAEDIESLIDQKGLFKTQLKKRAEDNTYRGTQSFGVVTLI
ncbi:unnamed protein product [Cuscuta europaea]|uniref:Uncharacterized protein n=1 Tax=Cuscuta europaea TaxID=41803 RepID=A0A9P1A1H5_CUSEU|nr:unnamed protein product [Cuscuta europaea]